MSDMTEKQQAARALGYLEGLSVWLWGRTDGEISCESVDAYDRALETLRKAIDWSEVD